MSELPHKKRLTAFAQFISNLFGKKTFKRLILFTARLGQIDLLTFAYNRIGILNSESNVLSGEYFAIDNFLKKHLQNVTTPILFDVGANIGDYSELLLRRFPRAKIFSFEPTVKAYTLLKNRNLGPSVQIFNIGLGAEQATRKIYSYPHDTGSPHSSVFADVFVDIHGEKNISEDDFTCTTIDGFCDEKHISSIDFLKIDTEGSEFSVLEGAKEMIASNKIKFIQFEFNEMNIFSRVFLRDFYAILKQYDFYRLSEKRLIPLGVYNSTNEIFKFQNILAVNKNTK